VSKYKHRRYKTPNKTMNEDFSNESYGNQPVPLNRQPQSQPSMNRTNDVFSQQSNRPAQNMPPRYPNHPAQNFQSNRQTSETRQSQTSTDVKKNRLESAGYYIFLATVLLTPLIFLPSPYFSLGLVKTLIISVGILASAVCYGILALKEKSLFLPTKTMFWTSIFVIASLFASALMSNHVNKAIFGQGFEIGTAGFMTILFIAAWVSYEIIRRDQNKVFTLFGVLGFSYIVLALFEIIRMIFGPTVLSMSVLTAITSTPLGGWYDFGIISLFMAVIIISALLTLPLNRRTKIIYWVIALLALFMAFIVNQTTAWIGVACVFAIMSISLYRDKSKKMLWLPVALFVLTLVMVWKGAVIAKPVIENTNTAYSELSLPWQITTDIINGTIKNYPLFGVGPNHFTQAYNVFKPIVINQSNAWNIEFNSGFGLIPTFMVTQGSVGAILWILLVIFLGVLTTRALKILPTDPQAKFMTLALSAAMILLVINMVLYTPSHAIVLLTFVILGAFLAVIAHSKSATPINLNPVSMIWQRILSVILIILVALGIICGLWYVKKFMAFSYFAKGVKDINTNQDFMSADIALKQAISLDNSDVYLQALSESERLHAGMLISEATSTPSAKATAAIGNLIDDGIKTARQAIVYDPNNYYNYLSLARISDLAASVKMANAYETAVEAYTNAINLNPLNPSLYVSLAQSQASNGKYDDALRTIGSALQVKNNYLDAVYLLSQVQVAQGNLKDAITSTQVATQMNPQSSLLFFQLGLLQYNDKNYSEAIKALEQATKLTPDYANAKYFLGLSYIRLNRNTEAITLFTDLAETNPDNEEVSFILTNIQAGKSPFADAQPPVTSTPEKRPTLPVKEKK